MQTDNGLTDISVLIDTDEESLHQLGKHMMAWRGTTVPPADQVKIPFVSLQKLKAMRFWALAQKRLGVAPNSSDFDDAKAVAALQAMNAEKEYKKATEDTAITKPVTLVDIHKWTKFWLLFSTYLGRVKGAAHIPLRYLIRDHVEVTQAIRDATYDTNEEKLINITVLEGGHFEIDNKTLYDELKPLVVDGSGWGFIKEFDKARNGRAAVLALKTQAEGQSAKLTRKTKAYASISSATFRGQRRGFNFDNYISIHLDGHNELIDLEEPVPESKKVTDFLKGIQAPGLEVGKQVILGDATKMGNFKECQQFLSTLLNNSGAQAQLERNVSSVHSNRGGGGEGSIVDQVKGGTYTAAQWRDLSQPERDRVMKYRSTSDQTKKLVKKKARVQKRRAAKAQSERDTTSDGGDDEETARTSSGAGAQFGSNGNSKSKKSKNN
jgi:hypothetical protein